MLRETKQPLQLYKHGFHTIFQTRQTHSEKKKLRSLSSHAKMGCTQCFKPDKLCAEEKLTLSSHAKIGFAHNVSNLTNHMLRRNCMVLPVMQRQVCTQCFKPDKPHAEEKLHSLSRHANIGCTQYFKPEKSHAE